MGTGPWVLDTYTPEQGVTYTKNPNYWDTTRQPIVDTSELEFYAEDQARVLAIQGGEVDVLSQFQVVAGGEALLNDPNIIVTELQAAQHRQIHMRADQEPFEDKRVRQAMALLLDRPAIIEAFFQGKADLGNDHPFAPVYPYTDPTVPQREVDVEAAKQLLADAGKDEGFEVELSHLGQLRDPAAGTAPPERRQGGRHQHHAERHGREHVLQRLLAQLSAGNHRLRPPRRADRVPHGGA